MALSKNKSIGLLLIILPPIFILVALFCFALVNMILGSNPLANEEISELQAALNTSLAFIGLLGTLGVMIGIPLGIFFLARKDTTAARLSQVDARSGKGPSSVIPAELKGWNWGAAGLTWIWGAYHSVWISLLSWISPINLFWWIVLGLHGNEWAWRSQEWASVQEFKKAQDKWKIWGIFFVALKVGAFVLALIFGITVVLLSSFTG
ncbi:MAG: hypothetical protein WC777_05970 [Candidatus Gracilibacteria bacterium]|jgi:hypothetical protein